jgi:RNA-directed DNA polymerase
MTTLEPADKLDAAPLPPSFGTVGDGAVNGPQDEVLDWHALDWRAAEDDVRRLRHRIITGLA